MADVRELIFEYLKQAKLMQLATSIDNQPWVCSVWFAFDSDLNIYWMSQAAMRHSGEVLQNARVGCAIALPHETSDTPRGVQLQGTATIVSDPETFAAARSLYEGRIFPGEKIDAMFNDTSVSRSFYKIVPSEFVLYDPVNFPDDPRQQLFL